MLSPNGVLTAGTEKNTHILFKKLLHYPANFLYDNSTFLHEDILVSYANVKSLFFVCNKIPSAERQKKL